MEGIVIAIAIAIEIEIEHPDDDDEDEDDNEKRDTPHINDEQHNSHKFLSVTRMKQLTMK